MTDDRLRRTVPNRAVPVEKGATMVEQSSDPLRTDVIRLGGSAAVAGGLLALAGNLLHPRYNGSDVDNYRKIADSGRVRIADLLILFALLLVAAGLVGVAKSLRRTRGGPLAYYGRVLALIGATIGVLQTGLETFSFVQEAKVFVDAPTTDRVSAFWATNAIDRVNTGLFNTWTMIFLGLAPIALAIASARRAGRPAWLPPIGILGGLGCTVTGLVNLLRTDQGLQIPFLIASLLVTVWVLGEGWGLATDLWATPPD